MADETTTTEAEPTQQQAEGSAPQAEQPKPQGDGTDWKAEARKWEARAKENKAKADKWDEQEEAGKSELERMTERAAEAERRVTELEHAEQVRTWASEVAAETHVPASILRGDTKEEMQAHANAILSAGITTKTVPDKGETSAPAITRESIEAIKSQRDRVLERAKNISLYK